MPVANKKPTSKKSVSKKPTSKKPTSKKPVSKKHTGKKHTSKHSKEPVPYQGPQLHKYSYTACVHQEFDSSGLVREEKMRIDNDNGKIRGYVMEGDGRTQKIKVISGKANCGH
jgi:hypothetical protein